MGQIQIHIRHQAAGTVKLCTDASFSEAHVECSGLVGMQPTGLDFFLTNVIFSEFLEMTYSCIK